MSSVSRSSVRGSWSLAAIALGIVASQASATVLTFDVRYGDDQLYFGGGLSYAKQPFGASDWGGYIGDYGNRVGSDVQAIEHFYRPDRNIVPNPENEFDPQGEVPNVRYYYDQGTGWTPNISLSYATTGTGDLWNWQAAPWPRVLWPQLDAANPSYFITLTPDAGYGVKVNGFDLMTWGNGWANTAQWILHDGSATGAVLASSSATGEAQGEGSTPMSFAAGSFAGGHPFDLSSTDYYAGPVVLEIKDFGPYPTYLALDNLNFSQAAVPEPSTMAVLGLGGLVLLRRKRRA